MKVHVDHLRRLRRFKEDGGEPAGTHQSKPAAAEKSRKYVVQEICGERDTSNNQRQYLIKWEGYEDCTWEPGENLNCAEEVDAWTQLDTAVSGQEKEQVHCCIEERHSSCHSRIPGHR